MCEDFPDINEYLAKLDLCLYAFHGLVSILWLTNKKIQQKT